MPEEKINLQAELEEFQEDSSELLREVKELVTLLVKTLKISCIYPSDNPIPKEFKSNLFKKFSDFLEENGELRIRVDQSKLFFKDKVLLQEEKKDEGVSFALFRDGVREITFQRGVEQEEIYSFLEIVSRCLKSFLPEDDIVTLFWEKEFSRIKFLVVDEFLNEDLLDLPQTTGDKELKNLDYAEIDLEEKREEGKKISTRIEIERFLRDVDLVPEKELKELKALLDLDRQYEPLKDFFSILKEVILGEKEFPDFLETVAILEKLLDSLTAQGDFYLASEVLLLLKEIEKIEADTGQTNRSERIKESVNRAGDKERVRVLTQVLNQDIKLDLFSVRRYLSLLNWNIVPHLVEMLGELESFPARKMICSVLENVGEKNIDLLGKGVYDRRWYVVRNIVGILGRIGSSRAIPYLKKTVSHQDIRVRKETLEALSRIEGKEVTEALLKALEDAEERLRIKVIQLLAFRSDPKALEHISVFLQRKDFKERSYAEKEALLRTWAKIGGGEAIPLLRRLVLKKAFFKKEKQKEISLLALRALASINSPLSRDTLKELFSKGSRRVRQQAKTLWEKTSLEEEEEFKNPE